MNDLSISLTISRKNGQVENINEEKAISLLIMKNNSEAIIMDPLISLDPVGEEMTIIDAILTVFYEGNTEPTLKELGEAIYNKASKNLSSIINKNLSTIPGGDEFISELLQDRFKIIFSDDCQEYDKICRICFSNSDGVSTWKFDNHLRRSDIMQTTGRMTIGKLLKTCHGFDKKEVIDDFCEKTGMGRTIIDKIVNDEYPHLLSIQLEMIADYTNEPIDRLTSIHNTNFSSAFSTVEVFPLLASKQCLSVQKLIEISRKKNPSNELGETYVTKEEIAKAEALNARILQTKRNIGDQRTLGEFLKDQCNFNREDVKFDFCRRYEFPMDILEDILNDKRVENWLAHLLFISNYCGVSHKLLESLYITSAGSKSYVEESKSKPKWILDVKRGQDRLSVEVGATLEGTHGITSWGWGDGKKKIIVLSVSSVYQRFPIDERIISAAIQVAKEIVDSENKKLESK